MARARSRYGLLASAAGAALLAVSVFLPWYAVTLHATSGAPRAPGASVASHAATALSGYHALQYLSVVLLVIALLALLDALPPLLRSGAPPDGAGASLALLGSVATAAVAYHFVDPPSPAGSLGSPALREGLWLALVGSLLMLAGGLWPRATSRGSSERALGRLHGPTAHS
jgi:hypothetical protein